MFVVTNMEYKEFHQTKTHWDWVCACVFLKANCITWEYLVLTNCNEKCVYTDED